MVVKHRTGWGYETLVREVSDSLHLRRFCLIALGERVPDESTVRKLTRRLGASVVDEITRVVIEKARRERRFRPRAARIDSTVVEADVRYPTDSGLALDSARVLAGEARKLLAKVGRDAGWVTDRSRSIGRRVRAMSRTLGRRTGERAQQVLEFTEQAGKLVERSIREAKRLVTVARRRARGRGAQAKLRQINKLEIFIERSERVTEQIRKRMRGEPISDRLVSIFDPDAGVSRRPTSSCSPRPTGLTGSPR
jgi:IS5 family transposase